MPLGRERLDSRERLRRRSDFQTIYQQGRSIHGRFQVLFYLTGDQIERKIAFVASRRVGPAVRRNRAKRLLREAYRRLQAAVIRDARLIFVARPECADASSDEVRSETKRMLADAGLLRHGDEPAS